MKRLHRAFMSFAIVAVLVAGSSSVFARADAPRERALSGSIVRIDRNTRTVIVREHGSGQDVHVKVPAGSVLRTNQSGLPATNFEHLSVGMFIRDVRVQ